MVGDDTEAIEATVRFSELTKGVKGDRRNSHLDPEIQRIAVDSRQVEPGDLFLALTGGFSDAHQWIEPSLESGAVALVLEHGGAFSPALLESPPDVPILIVDDSRTLLADLANRFNDYPTRELTLLAATGTNGKTTVSAFLESIFWAAGIPCGFIGTLFFRLGGWEIHGRHTTPQAHDLFALFRALVDRGARAVALEASSHGLALHRLDGALVDVGIFTNLGFDHLDWHGDLETYFAAKQRLFTELLPASRQAGKPGVAVINVDDPWGRRLLSQLDGPVVRYGLDELADVTANTVVASPAGSRFELVLAGGETLTIDLPIAGHHNVSNALGAAAAAQACGIAPEAIAKGLNEVEPIRGRLERVVRAQGDGPIVFVDYAHTPDALEQVIGDLRNLGAEILWVVFGCGGDRDRKKRAEMGRIAASGADVTVVTNDNPRSEDPGAIIDATLEGVRAAGGRPIDDLTAESKGYLAIQDRRAAIELAVSRAPDGAVVLIAGKGHETTQLIGDQILPFDDREVARGALDTWSGTIFQGWTAAHIAQVCKGDVHGQRDLTATGLIHDSRQVTEGDAFVALVAERDGHEFLGHARDAGARMLIVHRGQEPALAPGEAAIAVDDTYDALVRLGRAIWEEHRRLRPDAVVIGITGSNGKTTTKELTAALLELAYPGQVLKTKGNLNNHIGLPLTLSRLRADHRFAVLEMGASEVGDIALLTRIAPVDRAVVTTVAPAHLEGLGSEQLVIAEKGNIFRGTPGARIAVIPHRLRSSGIIPDEEPPATRTFGEETDATVRLVDYESGQKPTMTLGIDTDRTGEPVECEIGLALQGRHNALNLSAATALVWDLLPPERRQSVLRRAGTEVSPLNGRLVWRAGKAGAQLLDDSYNANPGSFRAALEVALATPGTHWLILGDMLELGQASRAEHERAGRLAAERGCDRVWAVGQWAETVIAAAREGGVADVAAFADSTVCAQDAEQAVVAGQVILVKGSRGVHLEHVVHALVAEEVD